MTDTRPKGRLNAFFSKLNTPFVQRVGLKLREKKYLYPSFLMPFAILFIIYACLGMFPFGQRTILILDMSGQYVYFFEQFRDILTGDGSILYTFERSLGGEFFGIFTYYLASPLSLLIVLFPKKMITEAIMLIMLIKCGFAGLSFSYYLDKTRKKNAIGFTMFSTMYALCAYSTTYQSNTMWMDALIWLPLVTLGIERVIKEGKFKLYIVALVFTIWSNYYIGYMVCIYVVLYFFCYLFAHKNSDINLLNERYHRIKSLGRIFVYSIIAVMITGIIILSAYYSLSFGKSEFQNNDFSPTLRFDLLDFVAKLFIGSYDTVRFEGHPNVYSGVLMLIMLPAYFLAKKIPIREKIFYLLLCAVFVASFSINTLDLAWHGFQMPIWLNYRYSFMFSFITLTMAYKGFEHYKELSSKVFFGIGAFLILLVFVVQKTVKLFRYVDGNLTEVMPSYEIVLVTIIFVVAYTALVFCCKHASIPKTMAILLMLTVSIESMTATFINWGEQISDVGWASRKNYRSFVSRLDVAMKTINEFETEDDFYRVEKTLFRKANDGLALDMRGVSEFTSTFNKGSIVFLKKLGFVSRSQSSKYYQGNEVVDSILGIKYVIGEGPNDKGELKDNVSYYYDSTYIEDGNMYIYKNPYALPLMYCVDNNIKSVSVDADIKSPFYFTEYLVGSMIGLDKEESKGLLYDSCIYSLVGTENCNPSSNSTALQFRRLNESEKCSFTYKVTAKTDGSIYMFLPSPYSTSATMYVNGEQISKLFSSDTHRIYNLANCKAGDSIEVKFTFDYRRIYLYSDYPFFVQVDKEALKEVTDTLKSGGLVTDSFSDTKITGTIKAEADKTVFSTIPYDKGWNVYVDGNKVETYKTVDTMLAFDITEGEHTIEMRYMPKEIIIGAIVSATGILLFIVLIIFDNKKRTKQARAMSLLAERRALAHGLNDDHNFTLIQKSICITESSRTIVYLQPKESEKEK